MVKELGLLAITADCDETVEDNEQQLRLQRGSSQLLMELSGVINTPDLTRDLWPIGTLGQLSLDGLLQQLLVGVHEQLLSCLSAARLLLQRQLPYTDVQQLRASGVTLLLHGD